MSGWVSVFKEKPSLGSSVLLYLESGSIVTGWRAKISCDDFYYCIGNASTAWDYEFNFDAGAVTHWMPLPTAPIE
jgi:hypothetical protein